MAAVPMGDRDRLAEILSRYQLGGQPPSAEEARAAADRMLALSTLSQAELAERGHRYLTVTPSDLDTAEAEAAIRGLWDWANRHPGAIARTHGTNDQTTWLFAPPAAETNLAALEAVAQEHNPGWWKIRRTGVDR